MYKRQVYLDGGWGVDALLKRESRIHNDIDLFVELKHYHDYIYVIKQHGFEEVNTDYTTDGHTVWKDDKQRIIDLHCFEFTDDGIVYEGDIFPSKTFSGIGKVGDITVSCIEPLSQVMLHLGYGTLLNDINLISRHKFEHLIIDEAQNIKNSRSKAYRAVRLVNATTRIIMTGTPLENNIQEYWGLMKLVNPTNLSYKTITSGLSEKQIVDKIKRLTNPFLLRRYKKDVLDDLPEKEEQIIYCSLDESQRKLYNKMLESIKYEINRKADRFEMKSNSIILSGLMYLQEVCCHPRLIPKEYNVNQCNESAKMDQLLLCLLYTSPSPRD